MTEFRPLRKLEARRDAGAVFKTDLAKDPVSIVPPLERRARDAQLVQRPPDRQMRAFNQPDDFQLLGCGISSTPGQYMRAREIGKYCLSPKRL